jgi:hypothetical protein
MKELNKINLNEMKELWSVMTKTVKCIAKKCKKEKEELELKREKHQKKLLKLLKEKPSKVNTKKIQDHTIKILKSNERLKLVSCQLDKCYKQTDDMVKITIKQILQKPNSSLYKVAKKYDKVFKEKMTLKTITDYDIDSYKAIVK